MGLFSRWKNQKKPICYACNSPIIDNISRKRVFRDSNGVTFELSYHYFPPCSNSDKIPENCQYVAKALTAPIEFQSKNMSAHHELMEIERLLEIDQENIDAWNGKGSELYGLGKYEEAIECFDKVIEVNPNNNAAWINKGTALDRLGNHEEAEECFDEAIRINPNSADAWNNKGSGLGNQGKHEDAIICHDKAIKINPNHHQTWINKGVALDHLGKHEEAEECFAKARELE